MENRDKWRLCGGTFFSLISDARNQMPSHAEMYDGVKSGISEPETLLALARIVTPSIPEPMESEKGSFRDGTLDFKSCIGWGWKQFLFRDKSAKKSFDDRIKGDYSECLARMTAFTNKFLVLHSYSRKDEYLVKALLELLDADTTISSDTSFCVKEDGSTITKAELLAAQEICLEPFLLGLWHYCIVRVKKNTIGKDTYGEWCPPTEGNNERPYEAEVGEKSERNIRLDYCDKDYYAKTLLDILAGKTADDESSNSESDPEIIDAIPEQEESPQPQTVNQSGNNPIAFNIKMSQTGNGKQFGYVAEYHEKDEEE